MNLLIETLQKRDKFSSALLYPVYFLLGLYYPLFSFMRKTFPAYMGQLVVFYHILLFMLLIKNILQKNSILDWIFLMLLFYLCCKSYQYNFDFYNIFGTMMLLFCAKNIEIRKIVKLDLYIRIVRCILFFTLPFMGLMINEINIWIGGRTRTFFGWTHPNMMGLDFLLLAMDIMYLRKEKKKWYDIILYIGFILLLEKTANSRTAEVIILMLIIIHLLSIMVNDAIFHKLMVLFTSGAFLLCLGIPLIGCYLYLHHPEYFASYNGTMLSRIQLSCSFYSKNSGFGFYGFPIYDNDCLDMFFPYVSLGNCCHNHPHLCNYICDYNGSNQTQYLYVVTFVLLFNLWLFRNSTYLPCIFLFFTFAWLLHYEPQTIFFAYKVKNWSAGTCFETFDCFNQHLC